MVSVLALNKLELKDDQRRDGQNRFSKSSRLGPACSTKLARRKRPRARRCPPTKKIPSPPSKERSIRRDRFRFVLQDYLDPGYRTHSEMEDIERPSFETSSQADQPHGSPCVAVGAPACARSAPGCDLIIGNLNEDGYLIASDGELPGGPPAAPEADAQTARIFVNEAQALGLTKLP